MRALPDVAAVADGQHSPIAIFYEQQWHIGGGTSASAPLWAGVVALIAQSFQQKNLSLPNAIIQLSANGGGFNVMLYAAKAANSTVFYDVTTGSNNVTANPCAYCQAAPGYNDLTGLGAPNVGALITQLLK